MRTRKQAGYVWRPRGSNWWWIRFSDTVVENGGAVRKQLAKKLTPVLPQHGKMTRPPQDVRDEQERFIRAINATRSDSEDEIERRYKTLGAFVEDVFFPHREGLRSASTLYSDRGYWRRELQPLVGSLKVRDFEPLHAQRLLNKIARDNPEMTRRTLFHIKSLLSAIFSLAINHGFYSGPNPLQNVEVPPAPDGKPTAAYDLREVVAMLRLLPEPARTAVAVAAFTGVRRGELEALEWQDYTGTELNVKRSRWNGQVREPKTLASKAAVPVIKALRIILDEHRARCGNPTSGPIFRSRKKTPTPLWMNNILGDQILPVLNRCHCGKTNGIAHVGADHAYERDSSRPEWKGWHAFRRGLATVLHDAEVHDLTIQGILRHSDVHVTQTSYIKRLPQQSVKAMKKFASLVAGTEAVQ